MKSNYWTLLINPRYFHRRPTSAKTTKVLEVDTVIIFILLGSFINFCNKDTALNNIGIECRPWSSQMYN